METLIGIFVILHFVGLASLLGGVLVQLKDVIAGKGRIVAAMFHGALTQLVTGIVLVGLVEANGEDVNYAKITTKLVVLIIITIMVMMYRKKMSVASWVIWAIGGLTLANVAIAVLWH